MTRLRRCWRKQFGHVHGCLRNARFNIAGGGGERLGWSSHVKTTFCQDSGRGLVKAPPDFSRLPLTSELPLKLSLYLYGFRSAAAAGEYIQLHSLELGLTAVQRILPLAGLTAGLALIPRTSAYAEEPPLDPIRSIVRPYTLYYILLTANGLPAHPQTNLLNPLPRTLHPRHRSNNPPTGLRYNLL